jgi:hypothetical protein
MGVGGIIGSIGEISFSIVSVDDSKDGLDSAVEGLERIETQADRSTVSLKQIAAAFATLTAISATAVVASDRVVSLERSTGRAAITLDKSTRGMYEYVQGLSSATDSQEEVGATMSYLSRTGLKLDSDLTTVYRALDALGDATDTSSTAVAEQLIPVLRSLGMEVTDVTKYVDALAYASNTTMFDVGTWSLAVRRFGEDFDKYGVSLEDSIAIMAKMAEMGVPQRKIITTFGEAFKEMGSGAAVAAKAEEELIKVQKDLNDAQDSGAKTARRYTEDMRLAGRHVEDKRRITIAYVRAMEDQKGKEGELIAKQTELQSAIAKAKAAPQESLITALSKVDPRFTVEALTGATALYKSSAVTGAAAKYQVPAETYTGTEKAQFERDQLLQNSIGKNIGADTASALVHLRDISGVITTISTVLMVMQGFSAVTAASTAATATASGATTGASLYSGMTSLLGGGGGLATMGAAGALSVGAGAGLGLAGVYGLEKAGLLGLTGKGAVRSAGGAFMDMITGDTGNAYLAEYLRTHNGQYPPGYSPNSPETPLLEYAGGGAVPGGPGAPSLAIVHGGEMISPAGGGGFSLTIYGGVNLSQDYPFERMRRDAEESARRKRQQRGY